MTVDRNPPNCSCCGLQHSDMLRADCGHVFCQICEWRRHHAPCTRCAALNERPYA